MALNYISFAGVITFFDDDMPIRPPPEGGAVWVRPPGRQWYGIPQIRGMYCDDPIEDVYDPEAVN